MGVNGGSIAGKNPRPGEDYPFMDQSCGEIRKSISVSLDGESPPLESDVVELHLAGCDACRDWREAAHDVTRQYRLQGAQAYAPAPEALRSAVVAAMPRRRSWAVAMARVALAIVGVAQVVITGRLLMSGDIDSFRDLGAMGVALGVGFLVAAFRPYRAIGIRPIVATAALLLVGSALLDLAHHRTTLSDEAPHMIAVIGWLLVMFLAWRTPDHEASPSALRRRIAQLGRALAPGARPPMPGWGDAMTPTGSAMARDSRPTVGGRSGTHVLNAPAVSEPPDVDHGQRRAAG